MSTLVLATKLFAPAVRPKLVARPRLVERLDATFVPANRLTRLSAPAGFGKTTVLSDWLTHLDQRRADAGELLRDLDLDPTKDYQPLGRPPGPPKRA